jgi:hypothetical protein
MAKKFVVFIMRRRMLMNKMKKSLLFLKETSIHCQVLNCVYFVMVVSSEDLLSIFKCKCKGLHS